MAKRIGANRMRRYRGGSRHRRCAVLVAALLACAAVGAVRFAPSLHRCGAAGRIVSLVKGMLRPHASMVTAVTVAGAPHVTAAEIMDTLGFRLPMPYPAMKKQFAEGWQRVSPWIAGAKLRGPSEGAVVVVVAERKPVAITASPAASLIDSAGAFIPFDRQDARHLPFVSGLRDSAGARARYLTNDDRGRMNRLLRGLAAFDPGILPRLTQAHFDSHGTISLWLEGSPTEIVLDGNDLAAGLERLVRLLPSLGNDTLFPSRIDCSCRNLAFVTPGEGAGKARRKG
jgi:hypothetical protein